MMAAFSQRKNGMKEQEEGWGKGKKKKWEGTSIRRRLGWGWGGVKALLKIKDHGGNEEEEGKGGLGDERREEARFVDGPPRLISKNSSDRESRSWFKRESEFVIKKAAFLINKHSFN